jgi:FkbM family methyltransferase
MNASDPTRMTNKKFDSTALGSDIARNRRQYWQRQFAAGIVSLLGLNRARQFSTEITQAIKPVATINTAYGPFYCRTGHGRLLWRAETFFTEEPDTIDWLNRLQPTDVLYDIGANVGMYAVYAAKCRKCRVIAFEPEAQNYALLLENIALNDLGGRCVATNMPVARTTQLGRLRVRYITKGGAYNTFRGGLSDTQPLPESFQAAQNYESHAGFDQVTMACSVDDLVIKHGFPPPTHLKIDVDGIEADIIAGAIETIKAGQPKSILIELNTKSAPDMAVPERLAPFGFEIAWKRSNWDSREDRSQAAALPAENVLLERRS